MPPQENNYLSNEAIARALDELGDLVAVTGESEFKARAYHKAARFISQFNHSVSEMVRQNEPLTEIPGVGQSIAAKVEELVACGHCAYLEKLREKLSPEIEDLLQLPGLGPSRFRVLHDKLGIMTKKQLLAHALAGDIKKLRGFSNTLEKQFIDALQGELKTSKRLALPAIESKATDFLVNIQHLPTVKAAVLAGSFRRRKDTIGDLDIVVESKDPAAVVAGISSLSMVASLLAAGQKRATYRLKSGLQVDVRIVGKESFGAALMYFTGSKAHNVAIRQRAATLGMMLNEYGLYRDSEKIAGRSESSIYSALELDSIPPELRENNGEIEAAAKHDLPTLIKVQDIVGDLHCHTRASDGTASLEVVVSAALNQGLSYIAITDHIGGHDSRHGISDAALETQSREIDRLNKMLSFFTILKGAEVDINIDGSLAGETSVLKKLDVVLCSINSYFHLNREDQTSRILRVIENPLCRILTHPTGRILPSQKPIDVDMIKVIRAAAANNVILEINGHPDRLDLFDSYCRIAKSEGAKFSITADIHAPRDFNQLRFAIDQARRGWIEAKDVLNTRSSKEVTAGFRKSKS